jgi:hypothetical protein
MKRPLALVQPPPPDPDDDAVDEANKARAYAVFESGDQVAEASVDLERGADAYLRLPYPTLDAVVGGLAPGDIWFVAAFSGRGKTTLLTSIVDEYIAAGKRVYLMGLESRPKEIRTHLACRELTRRWYASGGNDGSRIDGGDVLSGALVDRDDWPKTRKLLKHTIDQQLETDIRQRLVVDGARFVNEAGLRTSCKRAKYLDADLVVIDHIDHIGGESGGAASFEESVRACNATLDAAQQHGLRMLVATQLNNQGAKSDPLATFRPPQPHHVYLGPQKRMVATGMLGLYRPLKADLTPDELKAIREDRIDYASALEAGVMGVAVMKHRKQGRHEGKRVTLGVEHGRVCELAERDRWTTGHGAPRHVA